MKSVKGIYSKGQIQILGNPPISNNMPVIITFIEDSSLLEMNEDTFWNLIDKLNWNENFSNEEIITPLVAELSQMKETDIYFFEEILSEKLYLLDTKSHAKNIGESAYRQEKYFSPDVFLYSRACVVANGKDCFYKVLNSPEEMPKDIDFEPLLYVTEKAYKLKTGKDDFSPMTKFCYETYSNKEGWDIPKSILEIAKE